MLYRLIYSKIIKQLFWYLTVGKTVIGFIGSFRYLCLTLFPRNSIGTTADRKSVRAACIRQRHQTSTTSPAASCATPQRNTVRHRPISITRPNRGSGCSTSALSKRRTGGIPWGGNRAKPLKTGMFPTGRDHLAPQIAVRIEILSIRSPRSMNRRGNATTIKSRALRLPNQFSATTAKSKQPNHHPNEPSQNRTQENKLTRRWWSNPMQKQNSECLLYKKFGDRPSSTRVTLVQAKAVGRAKFRGCQYNSNSWRGKVNQISCRRCQLRRTIRRSRKLYQRKWENLKSGKCHISIRVDFMRSIRQGTKANQSFTTQKAIIIWKA